MTETVVKIALKDSDAGVNPSCFVSNLKTLLRKKRISAGKLAKEVGLDITLVEKVISGQMRPSRYILEKLSKASSVRLTYKTLITWSLLDDYSELFEKESSLYLG